MNVERSKMVQVEFIYICKWIPYVKGCVRVSTLNEFFDAESRTWVTLLSLRAAGGVELGPLKVIKLCDSDNTNWVV